MLERFCELEMKDQFSDHGLYTSVLKHVMKLILSSYVLLAFKMHNTYTQYMHRKYYYA